MANVELLKEARRVIEAAPEDRICLWPTDEERAAGTYLRVEDWLIADPWFRGHTNLLGVPQYVPEEGNAPFKAHLEEVFNLDAWDTWNLFGFGIHYDDKPHAVSKAEIIDNIDRLIRGERAVKYPAFDFIYAMLGPPPVGPPSRARPRVNEEA